MTFDVLAVIVFLNLMATIALWRDAARRPPRLKNKFITELLDSEPIVPKHQPPKTIGEKFASLVTEEDRLFFGDFVDFAAVVNWWLADEYVGGPWRLQEMPETELKLGGISDMPDFGRRYAIFHNKVRLGTLEVSATFPYKIENRNVRATIELDFVRLLAFDAITAFLDGIAMHISNPDPNSKEHLETSLGIISGVTQVIWQTQQFSRYRIDGGDWGELELQVNGAASWYFTRREELRKKQAAE